MSIRCNFNDHKNLLKTHFQGKVMALDSELFSMFRLIGVVVKPYFQSNA